MKRVQVGVLALTAMAAATVAFLTTGCDEGSGRGLTIEPSSVTLHGSTNTVTFIVATNSLRTLSLPIEWRVSNPALGQVLAAEGAAGQYVRHGERGVNIVTARDQYGSEGFATVNQY